MMYCVLIVLVMIGGSVNAAQAPDRDQTPSPRLEVNPEQNDFGNSLSRHYGFSRPASARRESLPLAQRVVRFSSAQNKNPVLSDPACLDLDLGLPPVLGEITEGRLAGYRVVLEPNDLQTEEQKWNKFIGGYDHNRVIREELCGHVWCFAKLDSQYDPLSSSALKRYGRFGLALFHRKLGKLKFSDQVVLRMIRFCCDHENLSQMPDVWSSFCECVDIHATTRNVISENIDQALLERQRLLQQ